MESSSEIVWRPSAEVASRSRLGTFMRAHGIASLEALQRRSVDDPDWYWDAVSKDVGIRWTHPYRRVVDVARGVAWPSWFEGGRLNFADNCLDRHVEAGRADKP